LPTDPNNQPGAVQPGIPAAGAPSAPVAEEQEKQTSGWKAAEQFKAEALQARKELESLKAQQSKRDTEDAAKRGEFEKLWTEEKAKREASDARSARIAKRAAIATEATKFGGLVDSDALRMFDLDSLEIEDDGETVKGVSDFVKKAAEAKPYLFGKQGKSGSPFPTPQANPGGGDNFDPKKVTAEDIRAGKLTSDQLKQVAALRGGGSGAVDTFGRPITR